MNTNDKPGRCAVHAWNVIEAEHGGVCPDCGQRYEDGPTYTPSPAQPEVQSVRERADDLVRYLRYQSLYEGDKYDEYAKLVESLIAEGLVSGSATERDCGCPRPAPPPVEEEGYPTIEEHPFCAACGLNESTCGEPDYCCGACRALPLPGAWNVKKRAALSAPDATAAEPGSEVAPVSDEDESRVEHTGRDAAPARRGEAETDEREVMTEREAECIQEGDVVMIGDNRLILVYDPGEVRMGAIYGVWRPFACAGFRRGERPVLTPERLRDEARELTDAALARLEEQRCAGGDDLMQMTAAGRIIRTVREIGIMLSAAPAQTTA